MEHSLETSRHRLRGSDLALTVAWKQRHPG